MWQNVLCCPQSRCCLDLFQNVREGVLPDPSVPIQHEHIVLTGLVRAHRFPLSQRVYEIVADVENSAFVPLTVSYSQFLLPGIKVLYGQVQALLTTQSSKTKD